MTGKRPLLIGIGIGLMISSMLVAIISVTGGFEPAVAQNAQQTERDTDKPAIELSQETSPVDTNKADTSNIQTDKTNSKVSETVTLKIPPGSTAQHIAEILLSQDLISEEKGFLDRVKERKVAGKFKTGNFELEKDQEVDKLIDRLLELP